MDWGGLFDEILLGFKRIGIAIALVVSSCAVVWGFFSIILIAAGKLSFSFWYIPCWILLLLAIAGVIGSWDK